LNGQPKGFPLGDGWAGIDFDDCVVNGKVARWASEIVRALGTYAELSPSGTGIRRHRDGSAVSTAGSRASGRCTGAGGRRSIWEGWHGWTTME
jgi:primase-polymerase (primpol)-like protein